MNLNEAETLLRQKGLVSIVMPDFKGNIFCLIQNQESAKLNEAIKEIREQGLKVFKNIDVVDKEHVTGTIKIKKVK